MSRRKANRRRSELALQEEAVEKLLAALRWGPVCWQDIHFPNAALELIDRRLADWVTANGKVYIVLAASAKEGAVPQ